MVIFMQSIALDTSWILSSTSKDGMPLLSAIFALGDLQMHVCVLNGGNITSYIKAFIN